MERRSKSQFLKQTSIIFCDVSIAADNFVCELDNVQFGKLHCNKKLFDKDHISSIGMVYRNCHKQHFDIDTQQLFLSTCAKKIHITPNYGISFASKTRTEVVLMAH